MNHLRTVGVRLSLALLVVVAGVLAFVYLIVVPSLEHRLVDSRQDQVAGVASRAAESWRFEKPLDVDQFAQSYASASNTRVTVYDVFNRSPLQLRVVADQGAAGFVGGISDDPIVYRAARTESPTRGVATRDGRRYAEAAALASPSDIILVSSSLEDALGSVSLVKKRLLVSALIALAAALLLGYGGARLFARRIHRLERAAERIAGGKFDEPIEDSSPDELLVDEDLDDATRREFLGRMREQVDRLTKLAGELLDLSRLDAGRLRVDRDPVDLARVAELLVDEFESVAQGSEHGLEPQIDGAATGLGDEQRILQIGRALVENALRHTPTGTRVRVCVGRENGRALLTVEDDGPGIAPEDAVQVFERFYRGDGGARASGSGLGLAIARELAEAMHGEIALTSRPGRTAFTFSLPAASGTSSPLIE